MGKWLESRGCRDKIVLATKFGMGMGDGKVGLSPDYMMRAVEDSLRRLKTDYIDLYQSHKDDEDTPSMRRWKLMRNSLSKVRFERLGPRISVHRG